MRHLILAMVFVPLTVTLLNLFVFIGFQTEISLARLALSFIISGTLFLFYSSLTQNTLHNSFQKKRTETIILLWGGITLLWDYVIGFCRIIGLIDQSQVIKAISFGIPIIECILILIFFILMRNYTLHIFKTAYLFAIIATVFDILTSIHKVCFELWHEYQRWAVYFGLLAVVNLLIHFIFYYKLYKDSRQNDLINAQEL